MTERAEADYAYSLGLDKGVAESMAAAAGIAYRVTMERGRPPPNYRPYGGPRVRSPKRGPNKPRQVKSAPTPESVTPTTPLRLEIAARFAFPDGSMTTSGLRNEINKGRLVAENIAGKTYTTLANIEAMRTACVIQKDRNSTSAKPSAKAINDVGSSLTETQTAAAAKSAQAHLNAMAQRLRKSTPHTSPENTPQTSGRVIQLKS